MWGGCSLSSSAMSLPVAGAMDSPSILWPAAIQTSEDGDLTGVDLAAGMIALRWAETFAYMVSPPASCRIPSRPDLHGAAERLNPTA